MQTQNTPLQSIPPPPQHPDIRTAHSTVPVEASHPDHSGHGLPTSSARVPSESTAGAKVGAKIKYGPWELLDRNVLMCKRGISHAVQGGADYLRGTFMVATDSMTKAVLGRQEGLNDAVQQEKFEKNRAVAAQGREELQRGLSTFSS